MKEKGKLDSLITSFTSAHAKLAFAVCIKLEN